MLDKDNAFIAIFFEGELKVSYSVIDRQFFQAIVVIMTMLS
jgi:hypothetical protein